MKKIFLLSAIVIFSVCAVNLYAEPTPVKVFSTDFAVWGEASCWGASGDWCPPSYQDNYSKSGSSPLSGELVAPDLWGSWPIASSSAGFFSVYAMAALAPTAAAYASAEWIFSPLFTMNSLAINAGPAGDTPYSNYTVRLVDLTDMTDIFNQSGDGIDFYTLLDIDDDIAYLIEHSFQTDHRYKLSLYVDAHAQFDFGQLAMWTNDLIPTVPEPTTMLLLGLGLIGLAGMRKRLGI